MGSAQAAAEGAAAASLREAHSSWAKRISAFSVAAAVAPAEGCGGAGGTGSCTPKGALNARRPLLALCTKDCTATSRDSGAATNEAEHTDDGIVADGGSCGGMQ
mmetsp:Transcript_64444/g.207575  ORF Transcript_64444/g.207575 Transcript_64444/m.207575 type:complete len:104 (+) Transcript_64444:35-346(+)